MSTECSIINLRSLATRLVLGIVLIQSPFCTHSVQAVSKEQPQPPPEAADVTRLLDRIDTYYAAFKARQYGKCYRMLSPGARRSVSRWEWVKSVKAMDDGIRLLSWEVGEIRLLGPRAKVRMRVRGVTLEEGPVWEEGTDEQDDYWVLDRQEWYYSAGKESGWNDNEATVDEGQSSGRTKINIETTD